MNAATANALNFPIAGAGPLSQAAQSRGYRRFAEVAEAVRTLPYGRVRDPQDVLAVLEDRKGTCSSKHRFLAALAHECGHTEVLLMLGLYEMSEQNTPGVGLALQAEGLMAVLEAHCYLMCDGQRYDFTGLPTGAVSPLESLAEERVVSPSDLQTAKTSYHRAALASWAQARGIDAERVWAVRERCIELLANPTPHADARDLPASDQSPPYSLRPAYERDALGVSACVNAAYRHYVERIGRPPGPMTEDYAKVIRERRVTVAESCGKVTGVLVLAVTEEGFLLENVAVDPSHHGKGLGRTLIEFAEAEARREGFASIYLYTHEKMTENRALYAKIGYVEFDRRTEKGLTRIYMRKSLNADLPLRD